MRRTWLKPRFWRSLTFFFLNFSIVSLGALEEEVTDCDICNQPQREMNRVVSKLSKIKQIPRGQPFETPDPFLFCVYHKDEYPAGGPHMEVPGVHGNGSDFDPDAKYRMYHGDVVPGFPQHPHRGFETITATIDGIIDHTDSLKNAGRYGKGDLQWMTAGSGVVHGENFPLINEHGDNPTRFFQIWLNLPAKNKMVQPDFVMHWASQIKKYHNDGTHVTVWAGSYGGIRALNPTKHSWAANPENEVGIYHVTLDGTGDSFELDPCLGGREINRNVYMIEGKTAKVCGKTVQLNAGSHGVMIESDGNGILSLEALDGKVEFLVLQGRPIREPVAKYGPFVMNTDKEIQQAFVDYRKTQFGGWPWDEDAVVFPRDKPRFALINGVEIFPPESLADPK